MAETDSFIIYGGYGDEVFGLTHYEDQYYSAPQITSDSGCNLPEVVNTLDYYSQRNIQVSYPVIPVIDGGTTYFYYPHIVYLPVYYVVPVYFSYEDPIGFEDPSVIQDNSNESEGVRCNHACDGKSEEYGSLYDMHSGFGQTLSEGITTYHLSYEEYPEKLNSASPDDDNESVTSGHENDAALNGSDVNESISVNQIDEQVYDVDINLCEEDMDQNVIKKVSLLSIDEVQKDIDETYEYGKANVYNEVLKGYTVNKSILEYLEWESHALDDIPEEEEPEDDSDEMDFDENVHKNINLKEDLDKKRLPDVEDSSHFASDSLSEESPLVSSQESLVDNSEIMMKENPLSMDSSLVEESDKKDPVLEHSLCEEKQNSGSTNTNQEDYPPVDSPVSEDKNKMISAPDTCSSRDEIHSGTVSGTREVCPYVDSPVIEENYKRNSVQDLCLSKEKIDSVSLDNIEEPPANASSEDRGEETLVTLESAASETKPRKKRFSSLRKFFGRICCCVKKPS